MKRSIILLLVLGACVAPPTPPAVVPAPQTQVVPVSPAPPPPVAWEDRARTAGNWIYRVGAEGSVATFVGSAATLTMGCANAREILVSHSGAPSGALSIRTTTLARTLPVTAGQARLAAGDVLLDAIIYSRGKFMVSATGVSDLILPPWPEIARVVEDCRR